LSEPPRTGLEGVRERIAQACGRSGRDPASVRLVAVSKTFPAERVREQLAHGQRLFGENRVQEALAKIPEVGPGATWHLVGTLQRNKARHVVGVFELIHGVDSLKLAAELDRRAAAAGIRQAILVQLNLAGEATKSGVSDDEMGPLLDGVAEMGHLDLRGLMTIPPRVELAEASRVWFARLRELGDRAEARLGRPLPELSMGMTDDFEVAVEEGATLVRVGRAIFGERPA
jgi:pyridoxal phosphate enzyme (YggS family)